MWPWQIYSKIQNLNFMYKLNIDFNIDYILDEFNATNKNLNYSKHFGNHHDGGWSAIALYSPNGDSKSLEEKTVTKTFRTELSEFYPKTINLIEKIKEKYDCEANRVRFMKLKSNSNITWHFDYDESYSFGNARLHIPIKVNSKCAGYICHKYYKWDIGEIWYGDFSFPHKVANYGLDDRIHLVIDLLKPKSLFDDVDLYELEEKKRNFSRKIIQKMYDISYKYPKKIKNKIL